MMRSLIVQNLSIRVEDRTVVSDVSLTINTGEIHALMGPNGSGKSSLAYAVAGHSSYEVTRGAIHLGNEDITNLKPEERARRGLFLSFQEPPEVGGVSMDVFLKTISQQPQAASREPLGGHQPPAPNSELPDFKEMLCRLGMPDTFLQRFLNEGFSGGEKKKSELLQFIARKPDFAVFDEIDTGLDVDALRAVSAIIRAQAEEGCGALLISHSARLLKKVNPDFVHVLLRGRLVASGGKDVLDRIEARGYQPFIFGNK